MVYQIAVEENPPRRPREAYVTVGERYPRNDRSERSGGTIGQCWTQHIRGWRDRQFADRSKHARRIKGWLPSRFLLVEGGRGGGMME